MSGDKKKRRQTPAQADMAMSQDPMDLINGIIGDALKDEDEDDGEHAGRPESDAFGAPAPSTSKKGKIYHKSVLNHKEKCIIAHSKLSNGSVAGGSVPGQYDVARADRIVRDSTPVVSFGTAPAPKPTGSRKEKENITEGTSTAVNLEAVSTHPRTRGVLLPPNAAKPLKPRLTPLDRVAAIIGDDELLRDSGGEGIRDRGRGRGKGRHRYGSSSRSRSRGVDRDRDRGRYYDDDDDDDFDSCDDRADGKHSDGGGRGRSGAKGGWTSGGAKSAGFKHSGGYSSSDQDAYSADSYSDDDVKGEGQRRRARADAKGGGRVSGSARSSRGRASAVGRSRARAAEAKGNAQTDPPKRLLTSTALARACAAVMDEQDRELGVSGEELPASGVSASGVAATGAGVIKRDLVERRSVMAVNMGASEASRARLAERAKAKPELLRALAAKKADATRPHTFYGPQLPVAWVAEKEPAAGGAAAASGSARRKRTRASDAAPGGAKGGEGSGGESEDSVSEEVLEWLRQRAEAEGANRSTDEERRLAVEQTAKSFLKSSHSGTLQRKPAAVTMQRNIPPAVTTTTPAARAILAAKNAPLGPKDYVGPQVPIDWEEEAANAAAKGRALRMDLGRGRDSVHIVRKGEKQVVRFGDVNRPDRGGMEEENSDEVDDDGGWVTKGAALVFDKQISRADQVGPRGERPQAARVGGVTGDIRKDKELLNQLLYEEGIDADELMQGAQGQGQGELDVDANRARDWADRHGAIDNTGRLYAKDRYVTKEKEGEPEGEARPEVADWYRGMGEQVKLGLAPGADLLNFDRMRGREEAGAEDKTGKEQQKAALMALVQNADDLGLDFGEEAGLGGGGLDIADGVAAALRRKEEVGGKKVLEFRDEKRYPRFEKLTKEQELALELKANADYDSGAVPFSSKVEGGALIDMSKQLGRGGDGRRDAGAAAELVAEIEGNIDTSAAIELEQERELSRAQGQKLLSGYARTQFYAQFDKQPDGRFPGQNANDAAEAAAFGEEEDVRLFDEGNAFDNKDAVGGAKKRLEKGENEWDKQGGGGRLKPEEELLQQKQNLRGRGAVVDDETAALLEQLDRQQEGTVLNLKANPSAASNWKRSDRAPNFAAQLHPGDKDRSDYKAAEAELLREAGAEGGGGAGGGGYALDLENVDHTKFKPGGDPLRSNLIMMSKQPEDAGGRGGHGAVKPHQNVLGEEVEELILSTDAAAAHSSRVRKVQTHKWTPEPAAAMKIEKLSGELGELLAEEKLQLDPNRAADALRARALNPPAWSESAPEATLGKAGKATRGGPVGKLLEEQLGIDAGEIREPGVAGSRGNDGQMLDLEPDFDVARRSVKDGNASLRWSAAAPAPPSVNELLRKLGTAPGGSSNGAVRSSVNNSGLTAEERELLQMVQPEELVLKEKLHGDDDDPSKAKGAVRWSNNVPVPGANAGGGATRGVASGAARASADVIALLRMSATQARRSNEVGVSVSQNIPRMSGEEKEMLELLQAQTGQGELQLFVSDDKTRTKQPSVPSWGKSSDKPRSVGKATTGAGGGGAGGGALTASVKDLKAAGVPLEVIEEGMQELELDAERSEKASRKPRALGGSWGTAEQLRVSFDGGTGAGAKSSGAHKGKGGGGSPTYHASVGRGAAAGDDEDFALLAGTEEALQLSARSTGVKKKTSGGGFSKASKGSSGGRSIGANSSAKARSNNNGRARPNDPTARKR